MMENSILKVFGSVDVKITPDFCSLERYLVKLLGFRNTKSTSTRLWSYFCSFYFPATYQARRKRGGRGGTCPPPLLADQLTLSQPGRAHYPHPVIRAPPDFQTLRRPCIYTDTRLSYTAYFNTYLSDLTFAYNANLVTAHNNLICAVTNAVLIDLRSS